MSETDGLIVAGSLWSVAEGEQVAEAERLRTRGLRRLHWDTTDGRFARSGGFAPDRAAEISERTGLSAEAHVMAERPLGAMDAWCDVCDTVVVHVESEDWKVAVDRIARRGRTPALAVSPQTPPTGIPRDIAVLCMTVTPGHAGSAFDERVLDKVAALRDASPGRVVGIDGGVTRGHADRAIARGAGWFVVGTDLFVGGGAERWEPVLADASLARRRPGADSR